MGKLKILIGVIAVVLVLLFALKKLEKLYAPEPAPVPVPVEAPVPAVEAPIVKAPVPEPSEAMRAIEDARRKARAKAFARARKKRTPAAIIKSHGSAWDELMMTKKEYKTICDAAMDYVLCKSITSRNPEYHNRFNLSSIGLLGKTHQNLAEECRRTRVLLFTMRALARGKMDVNTCVRYYDISDANIKSDVYPDDKPEPKQTRAQAAASADAVRSFCKIIVQGGRDNVCRNVVAKGIISDEQCRLMFPLQVSDCDGDVVCLVSLGIFKAFQTGNSRRCANSIRNSCRALMKASPGCISAADTLAKIYRSYRIRKVEKEFGKK